MICRDVANPQALLQEMALCEFHGEVWQDVPNTKTDIEIALSPKLAPVIKTDLLPDDGNAFDALFKANGAAVTAN